MSATSAAIGSRPRPRPRLDHLRAIMSPAGVAQFSRGRVPDPASGTCLDDNARVWIVAMQALAADPGHPYAREVGDIALDFMLRAQRPDGFFHNLADIRGAFVDEIGSEDSIGRALWACGTAARFDLVPEWSAAAVGMLSRALPIVERLDANHARAYTALGLAAGLSHEASVLPAATANAALPAGIAGEMRSALIGVAAALDRDFRSYASADWSWWTESLTWGNGRLPEAMLRAAIVTGDGNFASTGTRSLAFLAGITQSDDRFVPIGNDGWYVRRGKRAKYDQQPIEACAMVDAWIAAYRAGGDLTNVDRAATAMEWFFGNNTEQINVAVEETGGCHDGLLPGAVNRNQGAESTLAYLHAGFSLAAATAHR